MKEDAPAIAWTAPEHEHIERGADWFAALAVIVLAIAATSVLFGNIFFAILIIVAGFTLALIARREPEVVEFALSEKGVRVGGTLHPYDEIISFWVEEDDKPLLLIDTVQVMTPNLVIPLGDANPDEIRAYLSERADEVPMQEPLAHKLLESLGL